MLCPAVLGGGDLASGASGTTVSPWESVASAFRSAFSPFVGAPLVFSSTEAAEGAASPLLSADGALASASSLTNLSRAGRLASGCSLREGDEASSRGLLAEYVGWGEADIVLVHGAVGRGSRVEKMTSQLNSRLFMYTSGWGAQGKRAGEVVGREGGAVLDEGSGVGLGGSGLGDHTGRTRVSGSEWVGRTW